MPADIIISSYKIINVEESGTPRFPLFEVIERLIVILSHMNEYYYSKVRPIIKKDNSTYLKCNNDLNNLFANIESKIVEMLSISMNNALNYVDTILTNGMKNKELSKQEADSHNSISDSCILASTFLQQHINFVSQSLDGQNLQSYSYQLWIKFHSSYIEHLIKNKTLSTPGLIILGLNMGELSNVYNLLYYFNRQQMHLV